LEFTKCVGGAQELIRNTVSACATGAESAQTPIALIRNVIFRIVILPRLNVLR
jgi:3-oxoacyl-(acyl-carrier-protein) synthase